KIWQPPTSVNESPPANPPAPDPGVFSRFQHGSTDVTTGLQSTVGKLSTAATVVRTQPARNAEFLSQVQLISGDLSNVVDQHLSPPPPDPQPGKWVDVKRALPRFFHPTDPVVLIEAGKATFKHKLGSFSRDGLLYCRLTGDTATQLSSPDPVAPATA